jgi:PAS domain S-box-containing protein
MKSKTQSRKKTKRKKIPKGVLRIPVNFSAQESMDIILAIRSGMIDALVMNGENGERVVTLEGADFPYRVLIETVNDGVATLDHTGLILYANSRFSAILRRSPDKLIGTILQNHVPASDRDTLQQLINTGLTRSTRGEILLDTSGNRPRLFRFALSPIENSNPPTICLAATELTELVEANEALKSNEESLRRLSGHLLKVQDEERRHIARDLHDITGQKLAIQSMELAQVLTRKPTGLDEESRTILLECAKLNRQIGEEIRTLSYLLHPPLLDELGLSSAVKWYAEGFERRTGIRVSVDITDAVRLPPDVEVTLFRIIQESLTNIHRYSESPKAHIRMKTTSKEIELQIRDFGKGIHYDVLESKSGKVAPLGVGIQGMKERLRQFSGKLEIVSKANQGTTVIATLPVSWTQEFVPSDPAETIMSSGTPTDSAFPNENPVPRKRILIGSELELLRKGLRAVLERESAWEICGEASDGQDAINKSAALGPDLVILDTHLPVLSGLEAVRQMLPGQPHVKVLVFTSHDSDQTRQEIQEVGAHGCMPRDCRGEELLNVVRKLLDGESSTFSKVANVGN